MDPISQVRDQISKDQNWEEMMASFQSNDNEAQGSPISEHGEIREFEMTDAGNLESDSERGPSDHSKIDASLQTACENLKKILRAANPNSDLNDLAITRKLSPPHCIKDSQFFFLI